ncbi:hypothetical protein N7281_03955 [Rickettsia hoogstraalii]|uniref:hypothetical protein n=1 Tax=Rickettsia hoogstraalii TaxID=467174 RepID=UPI0022532226|nr:hypothetical protein [Rickettsia hoogstraalii]MCX4084017.1 hypothetical protein [Rickettsia hoogstraalii]
MTEQTILEKHKETIEKNINILLLQNKIDDETEINSFREKYKRNFVKGFIEGYKEEGERIEKKMLIKGMLLEDIIELTELSPEEIEKIKESK